MRMQSSHVEDYEGDEEEGFAWMHLKSNEQLLALAFDIKTRMRLNINNQSLNKMLTTLRSCSAMIILAPLVASNFLLLFLSPFSPPNTAKETTRKKCLRGQRFCVDTYKYGSRRVCKYGDSTITKCKYGRVGIVAHVDRSVTHILLTHHGSTSPLLHITSIVIVGLLLLVTTKGRRQQP